MADKPSWREIDARRDRGGSGGFRREEKPSSRGMRVSKADLDKLFSSGKLGELVRKTEEEKSIVSDSEASLIAQVKKALRIEKDRDFLKEARRILDSAEKMPSDMEFLERALEIDHRPTVVRILERILELLADGRKPYMARVLKVRCQTLPTKFEDPRVEELCARLLDIL